MNERDGYLRIGDRADYMESEITLDDANVLRNTLVNEMFSPKIANVGKIALSLEEDRSHYLGYSAYFKAKTRALHATDFLHEPSIFIGAHLRQFNEDKWHLNLVRNRMQRVDDGLSERKVSTHFKIICWGDQIVEAKRTVKFLKATPLILATGKMLTEEALSTPPFYKRVKFIAPLSADHCHSLAEIITRHSARVRHER
jgi:hypothetical protein